EFGPPEKRATPRRYRRSGLRHSGVIGGRSFDESSGALPAGELPIANDHRTALEDDVRAALDLAALVDRVVDVHVMRLRADRVLRVRVVDHEVGVRADRDRA